MSTNLYDPERRTVPRWRPWREAVHFGDLDVFRELRTPQKLNPDDLAKAKFDWESHRSVPFAGDFIGKAYALGQGAISKDAAEFILKAKPATGRVVHDLATLIISEQAMSNKVLSEPPLRAIEDSYRVIHSIRSSLHELPVNPLAYMDLAREYVALGQPSVALRPVQIALALAPNSRFVLRSASRFFLHFKDPAQAHDILRRAKTSKTDPWLVAAEIAVASAAGRTSSLVKIGRQLIESKNFSKRHISELASALGTLELEAGKIRLVKRHFRLALEKPTENAVAQAGWVFRQLGNRELDQRDLDTPGSYEARSWASIAEGQWGDGLAAAELWLRDEPFSSRPAVFGSWVAINTGADYAKAERLALCGLRTHPGDFLLLNNLVVALVYMGKIDEATKYFAEIKQVDAEANKPTYLATKGLIQFRLGAVAEGRQLYQMSIVEANREKNLRSAVWALLHLAREEFRYDQTTADKLTKEAAHSFPKLSKLEQTISSHLLELVKSQSR
jgi:tetratricopeptide (TPR) repeat protein